MSIKNMLAIRTWVNLTRTTQLRHGLISVYVSTMLNQDKKRFHASRDKSGRKERLQNSLFKHLSKFNDCFQRCMRQRQKCPNFNVWFMCFLFMSFFPLSKVSALQEGQRVIVERWSHIKIASSTHSFLSGLPSRHPVVTAQYLERPLDKDVNRLIDRSEDIIKIQDEEEAKGKHTKGQLKSMFNVINRCRFRKDTKICLRSLAQNYFNIQRLKCQLYYIRSCHEYVNKLKTFRGTDGFAHV